MTRRSRKLLHTKKYVGKNREKHIVLIYKYWIFFNKDAYYINFIITFCFITKTRISFLPEDTLR